MKTSASYVRHREIAVSAGIDAVDFALRNETTVAEFVSNSAGDIVNGYDVLSWSSSIHFGSGSDTYNNWNSCYISSLCFSFFGNWTVTQCY
ncbi:hypothetical protein M9194_19980 [Vibrio sp. S4M6]|uniref:hypothetical protein n=1 Tax=Vibrio sinus TaxID=2946865 RepID=UPI00202A76F4|nr:hypothetical protein [Vibrio sinus]MCL9783707.1 hypothetical protein [Vibrio sinus]